MAIFFAIHVVRTRCDVLTWGEICIITFVCRKSLSGILLGNTRGEQSIGIQHPAAKEGIDMPPTRDHEQSGRSFFVGHVGQTGAFASEAEQRRVRGVVACF